ncbi:PucR family transcriptional regulator [Salsuginibacillus kocurii]|uniref:PucR family transcriptional regulator n=1 Tax=Salsuginibacillus kocurii TaxID=427078 RepID=UPI00036B55CA|nr:PucR family transcriptional regulator [Salsuginibacillus kocurii]
MELSKLIQQSELLHAEIIAGKKGLGRTVQSVNMMDAPDIVPYLDRNQLLLTTAYSIREEPEQLVTIIEEMHEKGCAGLGIKSKRYLGRIPDAAKEAAERYQFPLLELPAEVSLGQMLNEALALVLQSREDELREAKSFHEKLSTLLHQEDGLRRVMRELAKKLRKSVALVNARGEFLYIESSTQKEQLQDVLKQRKQEADLGQQPNELTLFYKENEEPVTFCSIETSGMNNGYLMIEGEINQEQTQPMIVSQAANVISFELMKQEALEQHERMMKNAFFNDVLEGQYTSNQDILMRGKYFGLEEEALYMVAVGQIEEGAVLEGNWSIQREMDIHRRKSETYDELAKNLEDMFPSHVLFSKGEVFVILVGVKFFNEQVERFFIDGLADIQSNCAESGGTHLSFGIGNVTYQLTELPRSYHEALEALHVGFQLHAHSFIQTGRTKDVKELLQMVPEEKRRSFAQHALQPLLAMENEKDKEVLCQTLKVYLDSHCHVADTAHALGVHRNTVLFRLRKCEEKLTIDVKDAETSLYLRLALYIKHELEGEL